MVLGGVGGFGEGAMGKKWFVVILWVARVSMLHNLTFLLDVFAV